MLSETGREPFLTKLVNTAFGLLNVCTDVVFDSCSICDGELRRRRCW